MLGAQVAVAVTYPSGRGARGDRLAMHDEEGAREPLRREDPPRRGLVAGQRVQLACVAIARALDVAGGIRGPDHVRPRVELHQPPRHRAHVVVGERAAAHERRHRPVLVEAPHLDRVLDDLVGSGTGTRTAVIARTYAPARTTTARTRISSAAASTAFTRTSSWHTARRRSSVLKSRNAIRTGFLTL